MVLGAHSMRLAAALSACMIGIASGGALALNEFGLNVTGELSWMLLPLAQALAGLFGQAAWYVPLFYLLLAFVLLRGVKARRQFMYLLLTVIPFFTGLLYLSLKLSYIQNNIGKTMEWI